MVTVLQTTIFPLILISWTNWLYLFQDCQNAHTDETWHKMYRFTTFEIIWLLKFVHILKSTHCSVTIVFRTILLKLAFALVTSGEAGSCPMLLSSWIWWSAVSRVSFCSWYFFFLFSCLLLSPFFFFFFSFVWLGWLESFRISTALRLGNLVIEG